MKKCKTCYLINAKPCYECSACVSGDDHYKYWPNTQTNADRIRAMSDEELAKIIATECLDERIHFCQNKPECIDLLDTDEEITDEMCIQCVLDWLRQPKEE